MSSWMHLKSCWTHFISSVQNICHVIANNDKIANLPIFHQTSIFKPKWGQWGGSKATRTNWCFFDLMAALQRNISKVCLFKNDFGKMWSSKDLQKLRPFAQLQIDRAVFANGMIAFFQVQSVKSRHQYFRFFGKKLSIS